MKDGNETREFRCLPAVVLFVFIVCCFGSLAEGQGVMDEWKSVVPPDPPPVETVTVDPKTTALLLLDFNKQTCNAERRPRCIATIPGVRKLLATAREQGMAVFYSLSAGASAADIAPDLAPRDGDHVVTSGPDKFLGTDLEKNLKALGVKSVIVTGTAAHGAVLYTASGSALRGYRVIVPVDAISAEQAFAELYTAWHLKNAPRLSAQVTLTALGLIRF